VTGRRRHRCCCCCGWWRWGLGRAGGGRLDGGSGKTGSGGSGIRDGDPRDGGFAQAQDFLLSADQEAHLVEGGIVGDDLDAFNGGVNRNPMTAFGLVIIDADQGVFGGAADAGEFQSLLMGRAVTRGRTGSRHKR